MTTNYMFKLPPHLNYLASTFWRIRELEELPPDPELKGEFLPQTNPYNKMSLTLDISNYELCWIKETKFKKSQVYTIIL